MDSQKHVDGSSLIPKITPGQYGVGEVFLYWVGVTPSCPVEHLTCAGVVFPKLNELLIPDPMRSHEKKRVPVIGGFAWIDRRTFDKLVETLPRMVIRFLEEAKEEPGTGQNVGDNFQRPRRGIPIRIPRPEDLEAARKAGRPTNEYIPRVGDLPAAQFMFAQLCKDQKTGERGDIYPDTLDQTGLVWPGPDRAIDSMLT